MLRAFQIELNKLLSFICKIFHKNGTVFPGSITYNINQHILEKIKYPKYVIGVTGSSGKGTTTNMIYHILKDAGIDVIYNASGSNGIRGITTLILNNCNIFGKFKHEALLLELDERHLHLAFGKNKMTHLVLTNITRDQPARNGSPNLIYDAIFNAIDENTTLILNADDPTLLKAKLNFKGKIVTYGVDKTNNSYTGDKFFSVDEAYCPSCHHKLIYDYYHYGHIGSYHCPNCDFKRGTPDFLATKVNLNKKEFTLNNELIKLNKDFLFTVYATTAAIALSSTIGVSHKSIINAVNKDMIESKRGKDLFLHDRQVTMLESKNENALSYFQSLQYINNQKGKKTVILGFDNVSRRYKFNDLSWLWDVSFELLNDDNISSIVLIGRFKWDVRVRLLYANTNPDKIIMIDDLDNLTNIIEEKTKGHIYTMVCFDMTAILKEKIKEANNDQN